MADPFYTCCEDGLLSQVPPTDRSGLCPRCHPEARLVSLVDCLPDPVAPGRCRVCPAAGCLWSFARARCAAAGVPEAVAAEAVAAQILRELEAGRA